MFKGLLLLLFLLSSTLATNTTHTIGPRINIVGSPIPQYNNKFTGHHLKILPEEGYVLIVNDSIYWFKRKKDALESLKNMDYTTSFRLFHLQEELIKLVKIDEETVAVPIEYYFALRKIHNWQ